MTFEGVTSRRAFLGTVVGGATVALAGCSNDSNNGSTGTPTNTPTPTSSGLEAQLQTVREATADFEDPQAALQNGFQPGGPYVPGMGWHFQNPEWAQEAAQNGFDLEKPPTLTYVETDDGLTLGSVEYAGPAQAVPESPDLFDDADADATESWGTHAAATHVFAKPDGEQTNPEDVTFDEWTTPDYWAEFSPPDSDLEAGDTVSLNWGTASGKEGDRTERVADVVTTHPKLRALHVWTHMENPEGVFAPVNPRLTSDSG